MFEGRPLIIATKHRKEQVIAPILEEAFSVKCFVDESFDTDMLGTFSGEVERKHDPVSTARLKCLKAMELNNCDLGIASEGSFGSHPSIVFASANDAFLIFIDKKNNLEIIARKLSLETNFNGSKIKSEKELLEFAEKAKFPSHGLILKTSKTSTKNIIKGITDLKYLKDAYNSLTLKNRYVYAETDMRALYNPSRMIVIESATRKLVDKILSSCPKCETPGFGVTDLKKGLPCDLCGQPTKSTLSFTYTCQKCNYKSEKKYPNDKKVEDPRYCDFCNP